MQAEDAERLKTVMSRIDFRVADLLDLLRSFGVPEDELILPKLEHKIKRTEMPDGTVFLFDSDGGSVIVSPSLKVTVHDWNGPDGMVDQEVERMKARKEKVSNGED